MIALFPPALILEVFTTYSVIKASMKEISVSLVTKVDFSLWNLFLVVPTFVAIYVSANALSSGRILRNLIENYSNYCNDENVFQKVKNLCNCRSNIKSFIVNAD